MRNRKKVFIHLDSGRGFSRQLLKGIYDYNNKISQWGIIFQSAYYLKPEDFSKVNIDIIKAYQPDGCILAYSNNLPKLLKMGIPIVQTTSMNRNIHVPYVMGNYDADGQMAVNYFLGIGFRNIGFFGVNKLSWSKGRCESVRKYAKIKNMNFFVYDHETNLESINHKINFNKLIKWLQFVPKPVGILCCNDDFGQILINACSVAGIKVPHEVAVLGVDNDELLCNITFPNMSSISRNLTDAASNLCSLLGRMMNGERMINTTVTTQPLEVIVRRSTDTIATSDTEVVKAIRFIRDNAKAGVSVDQVVKSTLLSKRRLYSRFKEVTGHSINHEIQLTRLSSFKKLLKESNISVNEIAYQIGFDDITHVSRWFFNMEGLTPTQWRNKNISL